MKQTSQYRAQAILGILAAMLLLVGASSVSMAATSGQSESADYVLGGRTLPCEDVLYDVCSDVTEAFYCPDELGALCDELKDVITCPSPNLCAAPFYSTSQMWSTCNDLVAGVGGVVFCDVAGSWVDIEISDNLLGNPGATVTCRMPDLMVGGFVQHDTATATTRFHWPIGFVYGGGRVPLIPLPDFCDTSSGTLDIGVFLHTETTTTGTVTLTSS